MNETQDNVESAVGGTAAASKPRSHRGLVVAGVVIIVCAVIAVILYKKNHISHASIAGKPALAATADQLPRTIVTPHLEQEMTPGKNVLWCATFQVAWNKLIDFYGKPAIASDNSEMARILNKRAVTAADMDTESYIAMAGMGSQSFIASVRKELDRKFNGQASPRYLDKLAVAGPVAYCYLFKNLPFQHKFGRFTKALKFGDAEVASFGLGEGSKGAEHVAVYQIQLYDFVSPDDFVIELKTKSSADKLILAKVSPSATLNETVQNVLQRTQKMPEGAPKVLQIPLLNFDVERDYSELGVKSAFLQEIRFKLDEEGAVLKSEGVVLGEVMPWEPPRLIFDKPFLIVIMRTDAANPYFALWVDNPELLVKY